MRDALLPWLVLCFPCVLAAIGYLLGRHQAMRGHAARVEGLISPILAASVFLGLKKWLWDGQSFPRMLAPMIALGPFAVGIWVGSRRVVNRRRRNKLCLTCGYDLTGNVSGVCPECGTAVEEPR